MFIRTNGLQHFWENKDFLDIFQLILGEMLQGHVDLQRIQNTLISLTHSDITGKRQRQTTNDFISPSSVSNLFVAFSPKLIYSSLIFTINKSYCMRWCYLLERYHNVFFTFYLLGRLIHIWCADEYL